MSDLYIMLEEAYDATNHVNRTSKLQAICDRWNLSMFEVTQAYNDFIDSDMFYAQRGM